MVFFRNRSTAIDNRKSKDVLEAAQLYLQRQGAAELKIDLVEVDSRLSLLIRAKPSARLRYPNPIGLQLRHFIKQCISVDIDAVYWCFDEVQSSPQYAKAVSPEKVEPRFTQARASQSDPSLSIYDIRHLAKTAMEVSEISFTEFQQYAVSA